MRGGTAALSHLSRRHDRSLVAPYLELPHFVVAADEMHKRKPEGSTPLSLVWRLMRVHDPAP